VTYIFDYNISWMRIIKYLFQDFVQKLWEPFITTSLNISGTQVINNLKLMPKEIIDNVDYIIDDWILSWKSSVLIDFVSDEIIER
jgi:tRNA A37 threonylcarbamoyladenosine synthetase subunit TsaC/SUA5/YrdC